MSGDGTHVRLSDDWRDNGWFSFPRKFARDRSLSWKAKGIAALLASHSDSFKFSASELERWAKDGRDGTAAGIRELEASGYLVRERQPSGEMVYRLFPEPHTENPEEAGQEPHTEIPPTENPVTEKPGVLKKTTPKETMGVGDSRSDMSADALFDLPGLDKPVDEIPAGIPPDAPTFEDFWQAYPPDRRVAKKNAEKAWRKALFGVPAASRGELAHLILDGAKRYAKERADEPVKFTKHPATWLNGGCWVDEPGANKTSSAYRPYRDEDMYPGAEPWFKPEDLED